MKIGLPLNQLNNEGRRRGDEGRKGEEVEGEKAECGQKYGVPF